MPEILLEKYTDGGLLGVIMFVNIPRRFDMERMIVQFVVDADVDDVYSIGPKCWRGKTIDCNAAYRFPYGILRVCCEPI